MIQIIDMQEFYNYDPEDDGSSNDDIADDFSFDIDKPIVKGEDDFPNVNC